MKPIVVILVAVASGLAVTTVQFAHQARLERKRADTELALRQKQKVRITEMERLQAQLEQALMNAQGGALMPAVNPVNKAAAGSLPSTATAVANARNTTVDSGMSNSSSAPSARFLDGARHLMQSPAARNFMRSQMRTSLWRM